MINPFLNLPLDDGGPKRRANLWRLLPKVVHDMCDHPGATAAERRPRIGVDYRDITVCYHAMMKGGLVRMRTGGPRTRSLYVLTDRAEVLFHRKSLQQFTAWANEEHERQEAARITPMQPASPTPAQTPDAPASEWPKMLPCMHPACRKLRKATWAGDRYHPECRRSVQSMSSDAGEPYSVGSATGGRRRRAS